MHKTLIQKAFKKAKKERLKIGDKRPSLTSQSEDISDYISIVCNYDIGEMRLRQYLNQSIDLNMETEDININQLKVINGLCNYLGFENYEGFINKQITDISTLGEQAKIDATSKENIGTPINIWIRKNKIVVTFSILLFAILIINTSFDKQRWMVWEKYHYVEVEADVKKYKSYQLKELDQKLIKNFKKINSPDCNTDCFTIEGKAKVWYWKKNNKEIELYTSAGLHPTNGKTLKPITIHMIRKYICK